MTHMTDAPIASAAPGPAMACAGIVTSRPFARIVLGDLVYDVAERDNDPEALAFRNVGFGDWMCLSRSLEDGWSRIGADILQADPASLRRFLLTHAVRQSGWYRTGEVIHFDTLGTAWSVHCHDAGRADVVLADHAPRAVDPGLAQSEDPREQAIELLLIAYPDLATRLGAEVDHWAVRLASGAVVTPVF